MLIKVRPDIYVNTDQIVTVYFGDDGTALIALPGETVTVSASAARGMMEFLEPNESLIFDEALAIKPADDLRNKIAVMLRDTWKGASLEQIECILNCGELAARIALEDLEAERVAVKVNGLWYHANSSEAQAWFRSNPDPSTEVAALPDAFDPVAACSGSTVAPKTES